MCCFQSPKTGVNEVQELDGAYAESENISVWDFTDKQEPDVNNPCIQTEVSFDPILHMVMRRDVLSKLDPITLKQAAGMAMKNLVGDHSESFRCLKHKSSSVFWQPWKETARSEDN